jgi:ABC-2 type transport system permease protein
MAVILMIVGMFLFVRRKSDSAGFSAPNKFLQTTYRIIIALIVCLLPIYMIFQNIVNKNPFTGSTLFEYFIEYLVAVFVFFLYELITTRKWKNMLKAIPSLLILAVLNIVILTGMYGIYKNVLSFTPKADEVQAVQILSSENPSYSSEDLLYFTKSAEEIELNNPVIKQVVCDNLKDAVNTINDSLSNYQNAYRSSTVKTVAIRTGLRTYYRNIVLSDSDLRTIAKELSQNEAYKKAYMELPELGKASTTVSLSDVSLSEHSTKLIYNTLREEVKSLGFEKWYSILNQYSWDNNSYYIDTVILDGAVGFNNYSARIPLDTTLKNTCNLYFQEANKANSENLENLLTLLNSENNGKYQFSIDITPYNFDAKYIIPTYYDYGDGEKSLFTFNAEQIAALTNLFKTAQDNTPTIDFPFLTVNVSYTDMDTYKGNSYKLFIAVTEPSDFELIQELSR